MKRMTYEEHCKKWKRSMELVRKYNERLIEEWQSIPWWKFWVQRPSPDEQLRIICENWRKFERLPRPLMSDYLNLTRITASGGATWYAGANSTDSGSNTGWTFTDPPSE